MVNTKIIAISIQFITIPYIIQFLKIGRFDKSKNKCSTEVRVFNFNQKGIASIFLVFILLVGLVTGVYLVQHPKIFQSKAYESGQVNIIDNFRKTFPDNFTYDTFVHLEIKPPAWESQSSDNYEYPTIFRVSLDESKLDENSDCEITGDPLTNCQEVVIDNPVEKIYLSWVLPAKSGDYEIHTRFYSDQHNTKDISGYITYENTGEVGFEVPTIFIGIQSFLSTIFDFFRKVPAASAINATAIFISHVYSMGETHITISQAQQLGFNIDFTLSEEGEIELLYDQEQLSKLGIALEFFEELDTITGEPRLLMLPKANPTDQEDTLQAGMEIVLGEVGGRMAGNLFNRGIVKISDSTVIKTIKSKVKIPRDTPSAPLAGNVVRRSIGRVAGLSVKNIARMTNQEQFWYKEVLPLLQNGEAYPLDPNISRPILNKLITSVESTYGANGLPQLNREAILQTVNNNWVVVVPDYIMPQLSKGAAFAADRLVIIRESYAGRPTTLAHEFVHVISANTRQTGEKSIPKIGINFSYDTEQANIYGAVMSRIYELSTDGIVKVFFGDEGPYRYAFPKLFASLDNIIQDTIRSSKGNLTYADFSVFALTSNDKQLMRTIVDSGIDPAAFMRIINKDIDGATLVKNLADYQTKHNNWLIPASAAGGTAIFLGTYFAASAHGEELPENISIIYETLDQDIDGTPANIVNCDAPPNPYPQCGAASESCGNHSLSIENSHTVTVTPKYDSSCNLVYDCEDRGVINGECGNSTSRSCGTAPNPYPQCGAGSGSCQNHSDSIDGNRTVVVTPSYNSSCNLVYDCDDRGVIPGECNNPKSQDYLNCSYSQEDSSCSSGTTICTGHTNDDKCKSKTPEDCLNLVQCSYNGALGSSCSCLP